MKSKFKKLLATALVLCLVLALLPAAAFADGKHTVTVQNNAGQVPANGTVTLQTNEGTPYTVSTGHNSFEADANATITVSVQPNSEDYELDYIKFNGTELTVTNNTATFTMPDNDVTLEVVFQHVWSITTDDIQNGQVACQVSALANEIVTITATPSSGYELEAFKVYGAGTNGEEDVIPTTPDATDKNKATFTMPNHAVIVSATFKEVTPVVETHSINCVNTSAYGSFTSDKTTAQEGDVVTISVKPNWGYRVDEIYYMTSTSGIIPPGQDFSYIGDNKWTFRMPDSDVWVYVTYEPYFPGQDFYPITVSNPGSHCVVTVPENGYYGDNVTVKLSSFDTGYTLSYLKVDGVYVKPYAYNGYLAYTFKMPSHSVAIEVGTTSVSGKYYIDTSYDSTLGGVEVWVNNNYVGNDWHQGSWADYNDTVSFKVKPYYSDDVVSVSVVGKRTGWTYSYDYNSYSGWYTFTMPNEDVTINVDFRSGVHKVYVDKVTDGKLTVSDDWAKYGQIVYITAVPDYGCTLSSLSVRTATGDSVHVYNAQKADTYYFYMPDQYVSVSAVFTGKYTSLPFNDVSYGDWYYDAVQFVYSKGIMDGVDYYKFAPNGTITRGMILTMLWRMAGEPFEMPVTSFTDVEIGRYYTTAVAWACRNGIADGMGESTFGPNDAITREELVTLLYRYAQYFGHSCIGTSIEGFADAGSVSSYAYNAMCWAYKAGVVTGTTGSRLNPQGTASRAEAAQMIMSFYSFLNS